MQLCNRNREINTRLNTYAIDHMPNDKNVKKFQEQEDNNENHNSVENNLIFDIKENEISYKNEIEDFKSQIIRSKKVRDMKRI